MTLRKMLILGAIVAAAVACGFYFQDAIARLYDRGAAVTVDGDQLENIPVLQPDSPPTGLVILVSDKGGIKKADRDVAEALKKRGLIVLPVDLEVWRKQLDADGGECVYLGSDIEELAKEAQRTLSLDSYFHPVVAGQGEGGTLAYAAVADAPAATVAGAVVLDPAPVLRTRLPVCEGAKPTPEAGGGFSYALDAPLPATAVFVSEQPLAGESAAGEERFDRTIGKTAADPVARVAMALDAISDAAKRDALAQALPIVDIPTTTKPQALALFYSGDGGWRDIDKSVGDWLAQHGVQVVGVDSLQYFWSERSPESVAKDAADIIARADPSGKLPLAVLGYSFGADTFPFVWPKLPQELRDRIRFVGLLSPSTSTRFQVTVGSWLGLDGDHPVVPAIAALPLDRVLCVYGEDEEDDSACVDPALAAMRRLKVAGGHHYDEDYGALAARLLGMITARAGA